MRGRRRTRCPSLALAVCLTLMLASPGAAAALTVALPSILSSPATVTVGLGHGETTATVTLYVDDDAIASLVTTEGAAVFTDVSMTPGPHVVRASGTASDTVEPTSAAVYVWGRPAAPRWIVPTGKRVMSPARVASVAGASTATMTLHVNGIRRRSVACRPGQRVDWGPLRLSKGVNDLTIACESRDGSIVRYARRLTRFEFPYGTCIYIDKSLYRLYWVKGQQLVKYYPIAHGRHGWTPVAVWKVLAKYKPDPEGIYGPRKMRLFRRVGEAGRYRYVFTRYGIHGTNEPWVIGTQASHGCIRMYNRDVLELWPQVPIGTHVVTVP